MICNTCRTAGDINQNLNESEYSEKERRALQKRAKDLHDKCQGQTHCDCQHRMGDNHIARG